MAGRQIRVSRPMLFAWSTLAGLILLIAPQKLTNKFQFAFANVFSRPLSIGRNISLLARTQQIPSDLVRRRDYNRLQDHIANLEKQLAQERQKVKEIAGLRDRFGLEGANLKVADVTLASIDRIRSELIINRGKNDGLVEGQFVLGDNSIIGAISDVSSRTARVRLITDFTSKIAVEIGGVERLMQGNGSNSAKIPMLSTKHKVKVADIVYARKKPGFLDTPLKIGTVANCKRDDQDPSLWDITVKPACNIEKLTSVAVIIMNPQE